MYRLEKLNVVRLTDSEKIRDALIEDGFKWVNETEKDATEIVSDVKSPEDKDTAPVTEPMDIDEMSIAELRSYLDEKGIAYKKTASKVDLLKLVYQEE